MQTIIKHFPPGIKTVKFTVASSLIMDLREIIRDAEVFVQYHGEDSAYGLGINGSLSGYYLPKKGLVCEVIISNTNISLITNELIEDKKAHKIHKIIEEFLGSLGIRWFAMEFKKVE